MIRDAPFCRSASRSPASLPATPPSTTFTGFGYQWPVSRPEKTRSTTTRTSGSSSPTSTRPSTPDWMRPRPNSAPRSFRGTSSTGSPTWKWPPVAVVIQGPLTAPSFATGQASVSTEHACHRAHGIAVKGPRGPAEPSADTPAPPFHPRSRRHAPPEHWCDDQRGGRGSGRRRDGAAYSDDPGDRCRPPARKRPARNPARSWQNSGTATARSGFARATCNPFVTRRFRRVSRLIARPGETDKRRGRDSNPRTSF